MAQTRPAYVVRQPRPEDIHNSFGLMGNESYLRTWTFKEASCACTGSYYITLTDTRLLLRSEDTTCCCCCCKPTHHDSSIFLRDIAEMREAKESRDCCTRICAKCCECCRAPKYLELRGSFGTELLPVSKDDKPRLQIEIPAAIGNHKLVSQY